MFLKNFAKVVFVLIIFLSLNYKDNYVASQECPEIYVPPYGEKPRDCQTSIGSTCLITCPNDFDIIGSCFRTCIFSDDTSPINREMDYNADLKLAKKQTRPFLISLKPKQFSFLPTSSINKIINSGKKSSCCNKQYRDSKRNEFTEVLKVKNQNLNSHTENCPHHSVPEHHLLQTLSKTIRNQNQEFFSRERQQNTPKWSGEQPYCVNTDVECIELDPPEHGFFYYCPNYAGLSCAIGCKQGYRLIGSRVLLCTKEGSWSDDLPTCQQI